MTLIRVEVHPTYKPFESKNSKHCWRIDDHAPGEICWGHCTWIDADSYMKVCVGHSLLLHNGEYDPPPDDQRIEIEIDDEDIY